MEFRPIPSLRTEVSAVGLGAGGRSRLGIDENGWDSAIEVVRYALSLGINFIDTSPAYGTEEVIGAALPPGAEVVISTKVPIRDNARQLLSQARVEASVGASTSNLRRDFLDVVLLHGVTPSDYGYCREVLLDPLKDLQSKGVVGLVGLSESFRMDPRHEVGRRAIEDGCWDALLIGMNVLNPSGFDLASRTKDLPVFAMHAARWALTSRARLLTALESAAGPSPSDDLARAINALRSNWAAFDLPADAYRFAGRAPGVASVLVGTGDTKHLAQSASAVTDGDTRLEHLSGVLGALEGHRMGTGDEPR